MPSNRELASEARELGRALGEEVETAGLNNAKLSELVKELRQRVGETAGEGAAEATSDAPPAPQESEQPEPEADAPMTPMAALAAVEPTGPISGADDYRGGKPASQPQEKAPKTGLSVGQGKAVTSRRGQLREYAEVRESDFDADTLAVLIAKGVVVDRR